ncbi:1-acyl-sn-glycerol-3-phosphate acyltransferase [Tropicibacter sp. R15_0]|uniref:1-acyl-sn-glycerol-3-phosphate acyltransferase n=1 Tax=Tropicibacter sp. R15_0 TaxID=2821101 RepID=UPI001ADB21FA|nr:1-acyl-sn-glycerol-3-phosphate acyltransferase [Tropicibacter sp. R15_0]MBO9466264.1 1-acyl-sn-glycerol-3-phosphate acyltransferase [Tropicibacter sp. R15_0]
MSNPVTLPLWMFLLILVFAAITFASHFLFPSVRWFFRRRMERAVKQLNTRLQRPIEPFRLLRRYDLIQRLIYDPEVTRAVVDHARETGMREDVAFEQARRYAREIVPSFSAFAYFGWGVRGARFLSRALYRVRLGHHDPRELAGIDPEATVIFVMNHRSNMDYVLVTHLAADRSALSYAVGEWAQVWPLSQLFRSMGAYFIRRKSRDAVYRKVLRQYVGQATRGGVTQAIFPEGGLSLDGALAKPKLGLLSYIVEGLDLEARDVVFVPVGLNYDRVLEDKVLIGAAEAGGRRFNAGIGKVTRAILRQIWLRLRGKYHRFGYAAVSFGAPVSLRGHPDLVANPEVLAEHLMAQVGQVIPVLPVPLVAHLLLENDLDRAGLEQAFLAALDRLHSSHVHLPRADKSYAVEVGLRALTERDLVAKQGEIYRVNKASRKFVEFYANSIRHLF